MKKCPFCGAELKDDSLFCTECGKELPKGIECPHCGASVNEGDVFCTECGKRIDEVPQATSSEPTKPKCPHCGAYINEGDVFCTECGKKIEDAPTIITETSANAEAAETTVENEDSVKTVLETPQVEEKEEESEYHYEYEEEPKTWRDYKLPIFGGIFIVLFLGVCWWYYSSSSIRVARERVIADSLKMAHLDSLKKAEAKMEEEAKKQKQEEESEKFCKQFSVEDLISLLGSCADPQSNDFIAEAGGLSFIYKDVKEEEYGEDITIVYGKYVEKDEKNQLKSTTSHSCFFQVLLDTSTQYRMNFSNKDDANSFFDKVLKYGVIKHEEYYYIPKNKLPNGETITVDSINWNGDYAPQYSIEQPCIIDGYYSLIIGDVY